MPVPQGLPSLSPMGEEFPLFWSLDMMRLGSSVFFCFFGRVKFGVHISARVNLNFRISIKVTVQVPLADRVNRDAPSHGKQQLPCLLMIEVGRRVITSPTTETGEQPSLSSGWSDAPSV